ncbi:putative receptor-like protein kinase At5g39000 [Salvia miltiorrhiza]|uniref:putative receptor-like protein kinase At5g39000 n=1 Tax=Salvia miltiorrhiza TaxID=226208 RepID=UPI0025ABDE50|nr:putative receptor-like protein kinase At5g39000 [Salvia miltiorrhiza]
MNSCLISVGLLLFLCFFITFSSWSNNQADFTGDVSINCGSTGASAARNGSQWLGDVRSKLSPPLQLRGSSAASAAINQLSSADPIPHKTARISRSQFSYAFQLKAGQKIIRLHFNPTPYRGFKGLRDFFTVEAGPFTLLGNFSASLTADALRVNTFSKEFCLNIRENQQLIMTFTPESSRSQDTYAFINGIEITSVPANLSYFDGGLRVIGENSMVYVDDSTALEIVHRRRIKQDILQSSGGFDGVFPKWAIQRAKKVRSKSWKVAVEVGFRYLIRLHFKNAGAGGGGGGGGGGAMFKILINEMVAHTDTEMARGRDQDSSTPLHRDYMVPMRGHKQNSRRDILISLQLFDELRDGVEVLAGFEVVKLSNPDDSLASPNPIPPRSRRIPNLLGYQNATATIAIAAISLLNILVHKLREIWEARSSGEGEQKPSGKDERDCRRFSLAEIKSATRNFSDEIGQGGFGKVYKGLIDHGQTTVAVKRLKSESKQGDPEFRTEVKTLSQLRHINLVSLIGYCDDHREKILVYEYMPRGTLADHLYKNATDNRGYRSLTWKQRLKICIGAARGLDYLHTGRGVIHRDVKASNILLDKKFVAKVSDFGLAKTEDRNKLQSHVSTVVKGTKGYLDPYYIKTWKLTRKSDIYAFGVVLLEVLCGRKALDLGVVLSSWAVDKINKGEVDGIVDATLSDEISPNSLKTFVEVAKRCLHDEPKNRPTMSKVVLRLKFALKQQDSDVSNT